MMGTMTVEAKQDEWIATRDAAALLGLSYRGALNVLHSNQCTRRAGHSDAWRRADVVAIVELRIEREAERPIAERRGPDWCDADGAARLKARIESYWAERGATVRVAWREKNGTKRIVQLQRRHVMEQMAERHKASGPEAANNLLRIIRLLCGFAVENDWRRDNPALGIKKFKMRGDGFVVWSEDDIAKYLKHWPARSRERLALLLLLYTGQRRSDVIVMGRQHVGGDAIRVKQSKTGTHLVIPLHPDLRRVLAYLPKSGLTFLTTQYGSPFKDGASFGNQFRQWCDAAGLTGRTAHGLRKSAAVRLVEAGCSSKEVAAITGHASLREIERYTKAAEQEKLARAAIARPIQNG